ncbi:MAG: acetate/propionate family kinase [Bacillota bacterium]
MNILVINCGSSSLKYQLINMENEDVLTQGLVERIGIEGSRLKQETPGKEEKVIQTEMKDHEVALKNVLDAIVNEEYGAIKDLSAIDAVGHRVVHAGEKYSKSVIIDEDVIKGIEDCIDLAPLHNPPNLMGIKAIQNLLPNVKNVAVFDTAFHQSMPEESYIYPLPYEYYEKYKVRRYGFHGTSHRFVTKKACEMMGKKPEEVNLVTCHLGNGASLAAVKGGKSVATSMGFTPLEGLAMGTRTGDLDPAIVTFLMEKEGLDPKEMDNIMNKKSGVLGISGVSSDFRDIEDAAAEGNKRAKLALKTFDLRVKKYIAAYSAVMGGVDGIVFTAGLGENSIDNRKSIMEGLEFMGAKLDEEANKVRSEEKFINSDDSDVKVMVIPTNEELMIARDTKELVE